MYVPGRVWRIFALTIGLLSGIFLAGIGIRHFNYSASTSLSTIKTRIDSKGVLQVFVGAGCFSMGSSTVRDEQPKHKVCLTHDYWLDQYEVTNESYRKFVDDGGYLKFQYWSVEGWDWLQKNKIKDPKVYASSFSQPNQARIGVNWFEANAYAKWRGGRLPTEAEWEYAARGPESYIYPWGNQWIDTPTSTDQSWAGAYNMSCNALEWVADWYDANYYRISPQNDPSGPETEVSRVLRGGSWDGTPGCTSAATRKGGYPEDRGDFRGIRVMSYD